MKPDTPSYFLALSAAEKMALADIIGVYMLMEGAPQEFFDASAPPEQPPVVPGYLLHTLLNLDPREPQTREEELVALRTWQRNAVRVFFNLGQLAAQAQTERGRLVAALRRAREDAHSPGVEEAIAEALGEEEAP